MASRKPARKMGDFFNWRYVGVYFPKILAALPVTLGIVAAAAFFGSLLGIIIALVRLEKVPVLSQVAAIFVSFIRGTPILVQLFIVYYGVPLIFQALLGIDINDWNKIIFVYISYSFNSGAFISEIFRAAIQSVPRSQTDAARASGLSRRQTYTRIVVPQAVRIGLPNFGTEIVNLLQDTSLAFTLGVIDVIGKVRVLATNYYHTIEGYFVAAILFVILSILFENIFARLDRRFSYEKHGEAAETQDDGAEETSGPSELVPVPLALR